MTNQNGPGPEPESKHCSWTHEPGHAKAGQQCEGFRITGSAFCVSHGDNLQKLIAKRQKAAQKKKEILEQFDFDYHELKSVDQVKQLLEKLANGVLTGTIKPEKARAVHEILRTALRTLEKKAPESRAFFQMDLSADGIASIIAKLPKEMLDAFVLAGSDESIKMIEDFQAQGDVITIEATPEPEPVTVDLFGSMNE